MARRVHVEWTTEETLDWEADFEVPDEVADDEVDDYFTDGNCSELVDYEGEHPDEGTMRLFERETERLEWVEGRPEEPPVGEYTVKLHWVAEATSPEAAVDAFRLAMSDPHVTLTVTKPDGSVVEV